MFNSKFLRSLYFIFLFSLCSKNVFSGLLPEALVEVGKNEFKMVKDFEPGDTVVSMNEDCEECLLYDAKVTRLKKRRLTTAILLEFKSEDGKEGLLMVARDQKFFRTSALRKLNPELFNGTNRSRKRYLEKIINEIWVKAKDIEVGDRIRGSQYNELEVTKVEYVKFNKRINFYELSLDEHHTFYVIDSAGHYILTHNIGFLAVVGIGALIGGISVGSYVAWKSHKKGVFSKKAVLIGFVFGAVIGAATAAVAYGCVSLYLTSFSNSSSHLAFYVARRSPKFVNATKGFFQEVCSKHQCFTKESFEVLNKLKDAFILVNKTIGGCVVACPIIGAGGGLGKFTSDFIVKKAEIIENEDVHFCKFDEKEKYDVNEDVIFEKNIIYSSIAIDVLNDKNGHPDRDEDGVLKRLFVGKYEVKGNI